MRLPVAPTCCAHLSRFPGRIWETLSDSLLDEDCLVVEQCARAFGLCARRAVREKSPAKVHREWAPFPRPWLWLKLTPAPSHEGTELSRPGGPGGSGTPPGPGRDPRPSHGITLRGQLARVRGQLDQQRHRKRYQDSRQTAGGRVILRWATLCRRGVAARGQTGGTVLDERRGRAFQGIQQHWHHRQRVLRGEPAVLRQCSGRLPHSEAEANSAGTHLRKEETHRRAAAYKETPNTWRYLFADMTDRRRGNPQFLQSVFLGNKQTSARIYSLYTGWL